MNLPNQGAFSSPIRKLTYDHDSLRGKNLNAFGSCASTMNTESVTSLPKISRKSSYHIEMTGFDQSTEDV